MKNAIKAVITTCLAMVILCSTAFPAFAGTNDPENIAVMEEMTPWYIHTNNCSCQFLISSSGEADVRIQYVAISQNFILAKATIKIQKRFLAFCWKTISIWEVQSADIEGNFHRTLSLDAKGTYRVVADVEFCGTFGDPDIIEFKKEAKY